MGTISIIRAGITDVETDAMVNAANEGLLAGGGVCGAIFRAAGYNELQAACDEYGHCDTGSAVITPGFASKAKYIIHAVGPIYRGGTSGEAKELYSAYQSALELAMNNKCYTISFPLISAGIYGYPMEEAWEVAIRACKDFLSQHEDYDLQITFTVLDQHIMEVGNQVLRRI